jgi:putative ABC transport system permease protein
LLADGIKATRAQLVASVAAALVVALVCLIVLVTAGRSAATERQVLASIEDAGSRLITAIDTMGGAGIRPESVSAVADLTGVAWAIGFGPASDAVIANAGTVTGRAPAGVPVRTYVGALPVDVTMVGGRLPGRPGEAVAGSGAAARLGLHDNAGPVTTTNESVPVVGVADLTGALARFNDSVIVAALPDDAPDLRFIYAVVDNVGSIDVVATQVQAALRADQPGQVTIETPSAIATLRDVVSGQLGSSSRQLMAGILGVGAIVVLITMLSLVSAKRRDFGRRRALGASRSAIVVLVLTQAGLAALAGAVVGMIAGVIAVRVLAGSLPSTSFMAGLAALTVLAALVGSVPPAVIAARRDPVRILRIP